MFYINCLRQLLALTQPRVNWFLWTQYGPKTVLLKLRTCSIRFVGTRVPANPFRGGGTRVLNRLVGLIPALVGLGQVVWRPLAVQTQQYLLDMHTIIRYRKSLHIKYPPGLYKSCQTMSYGYGLNMEASAYTLIGYLLHENEYYMFCGLHVFIAI